MSQVTNRGDAEAAAPDLVAALGSRSIALVGMMGAGKSSVGRRLAARRRTGRNRERDERSPIQRHEHTFVAAKAPHARFERRPRLTIWYRAALMSKKFTKQKKPSKATTPEQKVLERQRFLAARALRKRRRRKSHQ